jgi:hypothetical protein
MLIISQTSVYKFFTAVGDFDVFFRKICSEIEKRWLCVWCGWVGEGVGIDDKLNIHTYILNRNIKLNQILFDKC